jgi:nickel transport protein
MITRRLVAPLGTGCLMVLLMSSPVWPHGVEATVQPGGLALACRYSSGDVMDYAKVTVLAPGSRQPFQVGHTDKNGRFCFYPDTPGEWQITAEDGMGHRLELKVPVTALNTLKNLPPTAGAEGAAPTRSLGVLTGLAAIFGLSGLLFWFQGLRSRRGRQKLPG